MQATNIEFLIRNYVSEHPIVFPQLVAEDIGVSRQTASKYLSKLRRDGFLEEVHIGGIRVFAVRKMLREFEKKVIKE